MESFFSLCCSSKERPVNEGLELSKNAISSLYSVAKNHTHSTVQSNEKRLGYRKFPVASLETIPENGCLQLSSFESISPRKDELKKLFRAAKSGHASTVSEYLRKGGDPDVRNYSDQSLLHVACFKGHVEIVKDLLKYSGDPLAIDTYKRTALHYACLGGQSHIIPVLHQVVTELPLTVPKDVGQDIYGCSLLHLAVVSGCLKTLKYIVLHSEISINAQDNKGRTCLYMAVQANMSDMVNFLLFMGANKSIGDPTGWTPIHEACSQGSLEMVKILISSNADMTIIDKHLRTPLHVACEKGKLDAVKFLCRSGASVQARVEYGGSILHIACWQGSLDVVKYIHTKTSLDLNAVDDDNETACHWAAYKGFNDIVQYLVKNGANSQVKSKDGILPGEWFDDSVPDIIQDTIRHTLGLK